jgi:hypothetical protein
MKIIYQNSISGTPTVSGGVGSLSADYAIAKVLNDVQKQPFIPNTHTSVTITVTLKTTAAANEMSFFMSYLAESVSVTFTGSGQAASTFTNTYDFTNPYFYLDKTIWNDSIFLDIPANTTAISITLSNSTDVKSDIDTWSSNGTDSRGKFLESGTDTILYENYAQIRLGGRIQDNADNAFYQINRITGIGSGNTDIQVTPEGNSNADFTISNMYLPIYVNTIRAGKSYEIFNPSVGVNVERQSFGVVKDRDSGINYRLGEIRKVYSGSVQILEAERTTITNIIEGLRNRPVAMRVLDYQGETAIFGSFFEIPSFTYSAQGSRIYDMSLSFTEIV